MNISSEVNAIVKQAPDWNFAGDCALLSLMKRISQNLHERGEQTSKKLKEFETNVRITDIALNNVNNSLRSLQFGQQFVEYRIEEVDDDDFGISETKKKTLPPEKDSEEMAKEFLQNNLNMFRKNFEPVTLEVPDSDDDDDEEAKQQTTLFCPKNPYDTIPLPYIIGTKEWEEHKYAGLYDSKNNSEDEQSDEFSSSSSDEKPPPKVEAKSPNLQPRLDTAPLPPPRREPAIAVVKQSTPPSPISAPEQAPRTQPRPIISSQRQQPHEHDLFAALRQSPPSDDPPSTSSSLRSSPAFTHLPAAGRGAATEPSLSSSSSSAQQPPPPPKLFEEEVKPVATDLPKEVTAKPVNPIKRMPVNLFNDDEFNSFMTEIVDKVKGKTTTEIEKKPAKEAQKQVLEEEISKEPKMEIKTKSVNIFDDSPPLSPALKDQTPKPNLNTAPSVSTFKSFPKSLFDDDLEDDDDDFLSSLTAKAKAKPQPIEQITKKTSLFDDDDLDIDDIFAKKPLPTANVTVNVKTKPAPFDPDTTPPSPPPPMRLPKKSLFDDIEDDDDLFGTPKAMKPLPINQMESPQKEDEVEEEKTEPIEIVKPEKMKPNLEKETNKSLPEEISETKSTAIKPIKVTDLFNDDFSDDEIKIEKIIPEAKDEQVIEPAENDGDDVFKNIKQDLSAGKHETTKADLDFVKDDLFQIPKLDPPPAEVSDSEDDFIKDDLFNNVKIDSSTVDRFKNPILSESPPPDIIEDKEDPIVSMVADVTNNQPTKDPSNYYKPADLAAAQTIMKNYTSLFSDEPPDDSEFFQTLANSNLSSLSASKIFDHDQDFFEPALPQLPSESKSSSTGIFSDVPPDDYDNTDDNFTPKTSSVKVLGTTTRIHTIFYDDFSETARAGTAIGAGTPSLPIVNEESIPQVDEPDRQVPVEGTSPVKKLKMPNININVQALMPGLGPKVVKKMDTVSKTQPAENVTDPSDGERTLQHVNKTRVRGPAQRRPSTRRGRKENYERTLQEEQPQKEEKVKEPPKHSINIKPSLLDSEDEEPQKEEKIKEPPRRTPINIKSSFLDSEDDEPQQQPENDKEPPKAPINFKASFLDSEDEEPKQTEIVKKPPKAPINLKASFLDSEDDTDDALFSPVKKAPQSVTKEPTKETQKKSAPFVKTHTKLFDDSDDDDDLFASSIPAPTTSVPAVSTKATAKVLPSHKVVPVKTSKSLFSDDEDDDDLFGIKSTKEQAKPTARNVVKPDVASIIPSSNNDSSKTIPLSTANPLSDLLDSE